jgi:aspartyl-tRNA(Asn)/glutamyl-tRNA(Gln) amidotransferase subunit C
MSKIKVDTSLVRKVSDLANLYLSDEEVGLYEERLSKILSYVEQLDQAKDSFGKDWRSDTAGGATPERHDDVIPSLPVEEAMRQAPARIGSAFQVPRIIE